MHIKMIWFEMKIEKKSQCQIKDKIRKFVYISLSLTKRTKKNVIRKVKG